MLKVQNSHKSSPFQKFKDGIIQKYPNKPIIQDLDLIRMNGDIVKFLIEVKQTTSDWWKPYIQKNFPNRDLSKLDDVNYKALFTFAEKIPAEVIVYQYVKGALTEYGIRPFKLLNKHLDFKEYRYYKLHEIECIVKSNRNNIPSVYLSGINDGKEFKDKDNPNVKSDQQNIYH